MAQRVGVVLQSDKGPATAGKKPKKGEKLRRQQGVAGEGFNGRDQRKMRIRPIIKQRGTG